MEFYRSEDLIYHLGLLVLFGVRQIAGLGFIHRQIFIHPHLDIPVLIEENKFTMNWNVSLQLVDGFEPDQRLKQHPHGLLVC